MKYKRIIAAASLFGIMLSGTAPRAEAKEREYGFLFVYLDKYGIPRCRFSTATDGAFINYEPILALDLYEHAYFNDYGFNRDRYLRSALEYLDLERLNSDISS